MSEWTELRAETGAFVGYVDPSVPTDRDRWRLPVRQPFDSSWKPEQPCRVEMLVVDITRERWCDRGLMFWVFKVRDRDVPMLPLTNHVVVAGATEDTEYGKWCRYIEAMLRVLSLVRFHRFDWENATCH